MKIIVPDLGDFEEVAVIEILVAAGDVVAKESPLITLESDKAAMDVPSPSAGKITAVHVKPGDKVSAGSHIADMEESAAENAVKKGGAVSAGEADSAVSAAPVSAPKPPAASADSAAAREVRVPDIGDFKEVGVIEILVKQGDKLNLEDSILTLESDKAAMDIPAPFGGVVAEIKVQVGDKLSEGDLIALVRPAETAPSAAAEKTPDSPADSPSSPPPQNMAKTPPKTVQPPPAGPKIAGDAASSKPYAGPAVRKFARELGADLQKIKGTGIRGRILKTDVQEFVKAELQKPAGGALPAVPPVDFAQFGEIELLPLPRIRKLSAANLHRNWLVAPHVTQCAEADITDMEEFRKSLAEEAKKDGYRMTPLAFFIRAAVMALRQFPDFNASLHADGEHLARKKYFHIGVAVDTPGGLVVPVLRDAERKGLKEIARELAEISARAREGKLKADEMKGGCFTISSLGGIGGTFFTPIINLPEAAILGVSRSAMRPQWDGKQFLPRLILPLSLSYDHRIIDGAAGARFITYYANLLGDVRRLAL